MKVKSSLLIISFLVAISSVILSQEYEYHSIPDSNAVWYEVYYPPVFGTEVPSGHAYVLFNEDTVIDSKVYHKLYKLNDSLINRNEAEYIGGIREDSTKKVYYRGIHYPPTSIYTDDQEYILYDFSVNVGDTIRDAKFMLPGEHRLVVSQIDTIELIDHSLRRMIHFENIWWVKWIEGIGNITGLLFYSGDLTSDGIGNDIICFFQNDTLIYHNMDYDGCFYDYETGIHELNTELQPKLFPNPIDSFGKLYWKHGLFKCLRIIDSSGILILNINIKNCSEFEISHDSYYPGIYFYQLVTQKDKYYTGKFVIQ